MREEGKREGREGGKQHVRGWLMDTAPFGKMSLFSSYWDMQGFILMWLVHSLPYLSTAFHTMWYISGDTDPSQPPSWSTSALSSASVLLLGSASSALRLGEPLPAPLLLCPAVHCAPITSYPGFHHLGATVTGQLSPASTLPICPVKTETISRHCCREGSGSLTENPASSGILAALLLVGMGCL